MKIDIIDYKLNPYKLEIDYVLGEYYYNVIFDFEWLEEEYSGGYLDFKVTPISGSFFHETNDFDNGAIEITEDYTKFITEAVQEFRKQSLWLYDEAMERQRDLDENDFNYWSDYGI